MSSVWQFLENLLFPPKCLSCGEFLQEHLTDPCNRPLCHRCRVEWEREKGEICPECGAEMPTCRCCPPRLTKAGVERTVKLVNYQNQAETAGRRAILRMKKRANHRAIDFFATQLCYSVKGYMDEQGLDVSQVAFCYVPRGQKNVARYGFDQSKLLCQALAKTCGAMCFDIFIRTAGNVAEQKKLSAKERQANSRNRYAVREKGLSRLQSGVKCLFLVDDVITTGESMLGCVKALKGRFDGTVVAVSIARTPKRKRL